jgi:hypothetical protein
MLGLDNPEWQADLALQIGALELDAARLARAHRAQVRLFNENFAQSRAYWLAVWQARQRATL